MCGPPSIEMIQFPQSTSFIENGTGRNGEGQEKDKAKRVR